MATTKAGDLNLELKFQDIRVSGKSKDSRWDVHCQNGLISSIIPSDGTGSGGLLIPSLCHPHIHLDKCFLLSHPKYADLDIEKGDFSEALELTNKAKSRFEHEDLMERGSFLIEESISSGVTHMRAFVEVDAAVGMKCLDAGLALKHEFQDRCHVQICVFAQDPIVSYEDNGKMMMSLLEEAVGRPGVEAFGSTPYVENGGGSEKQIQNIMYAIKTALKYGLHLDFHIDYNLDPTTKSFVLEAIDLLHASSWPSDETSLDFRTIVFGHCTRLTLLTQKEWQDLAHKIGQLPISFVGLPTSDIFMMGKPPAEAGGGERVRGTLQVLQMINKYGLNAAIGVNNVGNAFTPQGSCDPLGLASLSVGLYQAGTKGDADILLSCISSRAKAAIGLLPFSFRGIELSERDPADFVVFRSESSSPPRSFRDRKTIQELVNDAGRETRITCFNGLVVNHSK